MSDWELAAIGDGALDLWMSQGTLTLGDFAETLRHYEQCVGAPVSPDRLAGAAFVTWFKIYVLFTVFMTQRHLEQKDRRIQLLPFGTVVATSFERRLAKCIGRNLADACAELAGKEQSFYFRVERS